MRKKLSIYIHIPFCVKKCVYCDFLSFGADDPQINRSGAVSPCVINAVQSSLAAAAGSVMIRSGFGMSATSDVIASFSRYSDRS